MCYFGASANKVNKYRQFADIRGVTLLLVTVIGLVLFDVKNISLACRSIYSFSYLLLPFTKQYFLMCLIVVHTKCLVVCSCM